MNHIHWIHSTYHPRSPNPIQDTPTWFKASWTSSLLGPIQYFHNSSYPLPSHQYYPKWLCLASRNQSSSLKAHKTHKTPSRTHPLDLGLLGLVLCWDLSDLATTHHDSSQSSVWPQVVMPDLQKPNHSACFRLLLMMLNLSFGLGIGLLMEV